MWFVVRKVYYLLAVIKSAKTVFLLKLFNDKFKFEACSTLAKLGGGGGGCWKMLIGVLHKSHSPLLLPWPKKKSSWPYFLSDLNPNKKHSFNNIILFLKNEWNMSECRAMSVRFSYYLLHARLKHRNMDCV